MDNKWTFTSLPALTESDLMQRSSGIQFINYLADRFGLSSTNTCRASTIFHRFYTINKLQQVHDVAAACLLIATKLSDGMISIQSLAERLSKATNNTNTYSEGLFDLKSDWLESLYYFEELILAEICYDLDVPDTFGELQALHSRMEIKDESMKNLAWIVLHDSFNTDICVRFYPEDIAAASLLYVYESKNLHLDRSFWVLVYSEDIIREIKGQIKDMYTLFSKTNS